MGGAAGRMATGAGVAAAATGGTSNAAGHPGMGLGGQSMPKRLSRTTGFEARRGGEPQNSGDAAERLLSSPLERRRSSRSMPEPASVWHRRGATGRRGLGQKRGLFASAAVAEAATGTGLFMAAKWLMASSFFFFWFSLLVD